MLVIRYLLTVLIYIYQSQNRKGCKAAPLLVTGEGIQSIVYYVVVSLPVGEQLYQAICHCVTGLSTVMTDGPKLRYLAKNVKISKFF